MKKLLSISAALIFFLSGQAQQKQGKITYQRTIQMQISFSGGGGAMENNIPKSRTDKLELNFADNKMVLKSIEEDMPEENVGGGQIMIRTLGAGVDDVTFCDFNEQKKLESRDMFDKKFLITDSLKKGNWKMTGESKTILNHTCHKATSVRIAKRMMMSMENGTMQRKEIEDTSNIEAWFTTDIPVAGGPDLQGQLPGMILELHASNGRLVYQAIEISDKPDLKAIKEPSKGKKVTPAEFAAERNKMMEEMQKNNPGGNMRIRMN